MKETCKDQSVIVQASSIQKARIEFLIVGMQIDVSLRGLPMHLL